MPSILVQLLSAAVLGIVFGASHMFKWTKAKYVVLVTVICIKLILNDTVGPGHAWAFIGVASAAAALAIAFVLHVVTKLACAFVAGFFPRRKKQPTRVGSVRS